MLWKLQPPSPILTLLIQCGRLFTVVAAVAPSSHSWEHIGWGSAAAEVSSLLDQGTQGQPLWREEIRHLRHLMFNFNNVTTNSYLDWTLARCQLVLVEQQQGWCSPRLAPTFSPSTREAVATSSQASSSAGRSPESKLIDILIFSMQSSSSSSRRITKTSS